MTRSVVLVLGPHRAALSGVSAHLNALFASPLAAEFVLVHFQVGSEGRTENSLARVARLLVSPFVLAITIVKRDATIVHLNTSLNARAYWRDLVYLMVAKLCRIRVVYQVHGGLLPRQFSGGSSVLGALLRATLRLADVIVVLAQSELAAYRAFVPSQPVVAVPNAIDCRRYAALLRPRSCGPDGQVRLQIAYVGRLAREKGLYELLQAVHATHTQGLLPRLTIAGGGPEEGALKRYAMELGLAGDVEFVGPVFGEDKLKLLAAADVFVLASYNEGLPYALLESMAAGAPVVATPVGAIPDVVADGVHGLLVPPRDAAAIARALAHLAWDRALRARMSAACRSRISSAYSIERLSESLRRIYVELSQVKPLRTRLQF
jgi:glycosyltransferase involved in cell wall biosynthesis